MELEKAQIVVEAADDPYKEIRVENTLEIHGEKVKLKPGAHVDVTIKADARDVLPKKS